MTANWWLWSAWVQRDGNRSFVYGCIGRCDHPISPANETLIYLDDGAQLVTRERIVDQTTAGLVLQRLEMGNIDPAPELGLGEIALPVAAYRSTLHEALGQSAARVEAYCSLVEPARFAANTSTWTLILRTLNDILGLPFTADYASHIGNFEVIHLHSWGEKVPPFLIEAIERSPDDEDDGRGVRKLQICRSEEFAREPHIAHVVAFGEGERVLDRLVMLGVGETRSEVIETTEPIDSYEFSFFDRNGETLLHREVESFLTEVGLVMSMMGRRTEIQDRLSRAAQHAGVSLGENASWVEARSSQRSRISLEKQSVARRQHAATMRSLTRACFPPTSEDRWFPRTLDDEVGVIKHFDKLLHGGTVKGAVLVDPFFGAEALERLVLRLQSADVALTIVTSWAKTDPDTGWVFGRPAAPEERLRRALENVSPFLNPRVRVVNLVAGGDQAFHDRYLLLYPHEEGAAKVFLLSNSVNRMAGKWPFCMSLLADDVRNEAQAYIEGLVQGRDVTGSANTNISFAWPPQP